MAKKEGNNENIEKGTNKMVIIVLFVLGLIVLGAASFGGMYLFMKTNNTIESKEKIVEKTYVDLGEFTVNLADPSGKRYFKGQLSVGYDSSEKKLATEINNNMVIVRDAVIFYLKTKEAEFVNNSQNIEQIKEEIKESINKELLQGKVLDVRFNSVIVQ